MFGLEFVNLILVELWQNWFWLRK